MSSGETKSNGERKGHKRKHSESGLASSQQLKDADSIKTEVRGTVRVSLNFKLKLKPMDIQHTTKL
eukprot:9189869-Pyramimonas_sp.AAC.1